MKFLLGGLPVGARWMMAVFALGFPLALLGERWSGWDVYGSLWLVPALVFPDQPWRLVTYALLPSGVVDWLVGCFWLATLVSVLGRHWSTWELWGYCLLAALVGGVGLWLLQPGGTNVGVVGNGAILFALLAAWFRLYGRERLILLGFGEISVRQAAGLVTGIELVILGFSYGPRVTLALLAAGGTGWLYLVCRGHYAFNRRKSAIQSERIARLEL